MVANVLPFFLDMMMAWTDAHRAFSIETFLWLYFLLLLWHFHTSSEFFLRWNLSEALSPASPVSNFYTDIFMHISYYVWILVFWCCIQRKNDNNYKNIICFFSFPFYNPKCTYGKSKRELEMAAMYTYRGDGAVFLWNHYAFLLRSAWVEMFLGLHNFPDAHAIKVIMPTTYALDVDTPPV